MSEVRSSGSRGSTTMRRPEAPSVLVASYVGDSSRALPFGAAPTTLVLAMVMVYEVTEVMR